MRSQSAVERQNQLKSAVLGAVRKLLGTQVEAAEPLMNAGDARCGNRNLETRFAEHFTSV